MVENARFVNAKLLMRKLGVTETSIVLNIFVKSVFPRYGFKQCARGDFASTDKPNNADTTSKFEIHKTESISMAVI